MIPYFSTLNAIGPTLYWATVLFLVMASLCCMVFTIRFPHRTLVYVSAATLAVALVMVAVPGPPSSLALEVLLGIASFALAIIGGGPAVQLVLALASRGTVSNGIHGGIVLERAAETGTAATSREVLRGGMTIGILERLATAGAIMAGFPTAIAVVVAIKGIGRFSELDAAEARERFLIGTLTSLIWACACAGVFQLTLS